MTWQIDELISGYLDGTLSAEQHEALSRWIEANPANADRFAEAVLFDNRLHAEVNAAQYKTLTGVDTASVADHSRGRVWWQLAAVVAACLLIGIGLHFWNSDPRSEPLATDNGSGSRDHHFASLAHTLDAQWGDGSEMVVGDRIAQQTIHLRSGFVRLAFDDGVEVTLQGPAVYELLGPGKTKLTDGLLTATVPQGGEGFTVETPVARVIDLGTSFGIDLREDGVSGVSVFDGEVEVAVSDASETRLLAEGESVRIGSDRQIEKVDFNPKRFEKVWPVSSGIAGSTESFRFIPPWPKRIRFIQSDRDIFVATEGYALTLSDILQVNISEPGEFQHVDELTPLELPAGARVRSYILHYLPETPTRLRRANRISGSITFDRPVLGLIVAHEQLLASSRRFTRRAAGEAQIRRQLDLTGRLDGDRIALSEDRRTVTVDLISPGRTSDLVRVIVDASSPQTSAANGRTKP